jgi:hypothetical protein
MVVVLLYNPIGLIMCFVTAVLLFVPGVYLPRPSQDNWTLVGAWGAIVFVWDFFYRVFNREEHWLSPRRGGHVFFIPVCVLGYGALYWYASQAAKLGYWFPHTTRDPFWN